MFLSNSSPKSKVQTSVLGLGVDFVFPLSQEQQQEQQEQQEQEPPPKSIRRGCTRSLKFYVYTTHGLLPEFKGLRVQVTHVTRRTRTKTKGLL